jgi:hypothetical protein
MPMKALKRAAIGIGIIIGLLFLAVCVLILIPHNVTVAGITDGFTEKKFDTREVVLNYVEVRKTGNYSEGIDRLRMQGM